MSEPVDRDVWIVARAQIRLNELCRLRSYLAETRADWPLKANVPEMHDLACMMALLDWEIFSRDPKP
jgi:hypothetical protein